MVLSGGDADCNVKGVLSNHEGDSWVMIEFEFRNNLIRSRLGVRTVGPPGVEALEYEVST
jgi:hypothetical protein